MKRAMARAAMAMTMVTRVAGNKEGDGKGRKSNGNGNKEGEGKSGKSNSGGNEDGKEEGNNMDNAYSDEGGGQATATTMVMVTETTRVMVMVMRWQATKRALARVTRETAMATRVAGKQRQQQWQ